MSLLAFWMSHGEELRGMIERHLLVVLVSSGVAVLIGVPVGILAAHRPRLGKPLVAIANVTQTIPSLALLGFLLPLPWLGGVGPRVAIVALILYGLLPIVRSTMTGVAGVDSTVTTAGLAMGMTSRQLLWLIELPLALPAIVSGIRVATVVGVGTATIAAAIGAGGLGEYIFRGLSMVSSTVILAGAIPAAVMAMLADFLLTMLERALQPARAARQRRRAVMAIAAAPALVALLFFLSPAAAADAVVVGSKNFTEQVILGELLAQTLEARGVPVTRKLNLGGTFICDRALRSGDIDVYPEYTGTALTAIFHEQVGRDREGVLERTRGLYADAGVTLLSPLGFDNTFAILVRRGEAEALGLKTIGDLASVQTRYAPGFGYEFIQRQDGYAGLVSAYGLAFTRQPKSMDLSLIYRAVAGGDIDVTAGDMTSALIDTLDLVVLDDDRRFFPPYDAVPVARTATLLRRPAVRQALESLAGKISAADMRAMNRAVDVDHRDVTTVVRDFLGSR